MSIDLSYLNRLIPFEWWKDELQKRPHDHMGPGCIVLATTTIVMVVWGKYKAIGFLATAAIFYPFTHRQIHLVMFLDISEVTMATICVALPLLHSTVSFMTDSWSMLLHVALGHAMITRAWRLGQIFFDTNKELKKFETLNEESKNKIRTLESNANELNTVLTQLVDEMDKQRQIEKAKENVEQQTQEVALQVDVDYVQLNQKLSKVVQVCKTALNASGLAEDLGKIDDAEQKLATLTTSCETKNRELETLKGEIEQLKNNLTEMAKQLTAEQIQTQDALEKINHWIIAITCRTA